MSDGIFIDREKEFRLLRNYYEQCVEKGINCGLLVYGWRRVGKTALLKKFAEEHGGIHIGCAWISDPRTLLRYVIGSLSGIMPEDLANRYMLSLQESDLMIILRRALESLCHPEVYGKKLVVVLDEFHTLVEKMAYRISRETKKKKPIVKNDILWLIREIIESKKAFWILSTSMGWTKIHEEYFDESKGEKPLSGTLIKMKVEPLNRASSIELARRLNPNIDTEVAEEIYMLSGGIPRIIEIVAPNYQEKATLIATVTRLARDGQFDEFFENIIKFVAEVAKRDYSILIETLKALEKEETSEQIAKKLGADRISTYNILEDLTKMEIIKKRKFRGRAYYSHRYPLLKTWLELRVTPIRKITNVIATELGITAEAYIRELLREYMKQQKTLELYDDERGTYLSGTADQIAIDIKRVFSYKETQHLIKIKNADVAIIDKNNEIWLIEIKAKLKPITKKDIAKLAQVSRKASIRNKILIQTGHGEIEPGAISEAIKTKTIIITRQGVKLLAKKIGYPSI